MHSEALIPQLIISVKRSWLANIAVVFGGVLLLSLLAQVVIPLPFSPVPITGQTFGVFLVALSFGKVRGTAILAFYLFFGALGLPIFAKGGSGLSLAPNLGYLTGMMIAAFAMGALADRGWSKTWGKALAACLVGTLIIFGCGAIVLSHFMPADKIFIVGVLPFLPGNVFKTFLAISLVQTFQQRLRLD